MAQSSELTPASPEGDLKSYSCLTCRQRKVKCDRRVPCSNCAKAEKPCSFIPPVRGKRKRTKPPREGLHARLKRYEELLKSHGVKIEDTGDSDSETTSQLDVEVDQDASPRGEGHIEPLRVEETKPKLITKEGTSRYFDSAPWSGLGDQFQHPEVSELTDDANVHESGIFFEPEPNCAFENLTSLHPPLHILPRLRDIYIDRVDPLIKILHLPTFWIALTNGIRNPQERSKSLEALMFAFYFVVIITLREEECQAFFGAEKPGLFSRYRYAARQALVNAGFLSTSSPMTLQAYALFMMCVRKSYRCDTLFVLSGVAIRLARKMGLHRDGSFLGLSPFEAEMRRRLWWHLVHVDFRLADILGTKPSLDLSSRDTKIPLNLEDEDLSPDMVELPPERNGITPIAFCLIRCEMTEALRRFSPSSPTDGHWEALRRPDISVAEKDRFISQIEDHLERKFLRYYDPANSLHIFISITIRSTICKLKLFAHNPRQFVNRPIKVPQSEHNIIFANSMKLLEYLTLLHGGNHGLEKYMWQIGTSYLWNTMLFVLIEARNRKTGPEIDKMWRLIGEVFSHYPQVFEESTGPVYTALGQWTLQVWDECAGALKAGGLPEPSAPEYINAIRRCRGSSTEPRPKSRALAVNPESITQDSFGYNFQSQGYQGNAHSFEPFESYDFRGILSFEMDPNEWVQWDQILAEHSGFN